MDLIGLYPFATASSAAFYLLLIALTFPASHRIIAPWFVHPVPPHQRYLRGFDSIRGGAALLVVLGHCTYFAQPALSGLSSIFIVITYQASKAVPVFCELSGCLIYRAVLQISTLNDLRAYCMRRFFRIYPVYVVGVVAALLLGQYGTSSMTPETATSGRFFADLFMMRVLWWPGFANPVAWSLYHEVLFYALLPLVVFTVGQKRMAAFAVLGILAMLLADYPSRDYGLYKFFLFGILASCYSERLKRHALVLFLIGLVLVIAEFGGIDFFFRLGLTPSKLDIHNGGFGLGVGTALVLATIPHLSLMGKLLETFPLRILGAISYSLYVVHPFVLRFIFPEIGSLVSARDYSQFTHSGSFGPFGLAFVLIPAILFWAAICFLAVESPFIRLGANLVERREMSFGALRRSNGESAKL